ncbi:hypothetical protein H4R35_006673, partial [Dimargaris xerosporica]
EPLKQTVAEPAQRRFIRATLGLPQAKPTSPATEQKSKPLHPTLSASPKVALMQLKVKAK